jgi:hypothetical protein
MKDFKITIRKPGNSPGEWDQMLFDIMKLLYTKFDLKDEPELCGINLKDFMTGKELRNLTIFVNGRDWQSQIQFMGDLVLIGDQAGKNYDYCLKCGHPDVQAVGNYINCNHCGNSEMITEDIPMEEDINDYSGKICLN